MKPATRLMAAVLTVIALTPFLMTHAQAAFQAYVKIKGQTQGDFKGKSKPPPPPPKTTPLTHALPGVYIHSNPIHPKRRSI